MALQVGCRPETKQSDTRTEVEVSSKQLANILFHESLLIHSFIPLLFAVINVSEGLLLDGIQESFLIASPDMFLLR